MKRTLGFWTLTALVTGNMIGSGVFLLPATLASIGSIGLLAWVLTAAGAILIAIMFARLSRRMPKIGGPYAYCRAAYGEFIGFSMAYIYWIALWVGNAAIVIAFVAYLTIFFPVLAHNAYLDYAVGVATLWTLTGINILGVKNAGVVQLITTILKIVPLVLMATLGFAHVNLHHFAEFNVSGQSHISAFVSAATLTLWSFIGLESATVPADDVVNPERTIYRSTITGVCIAAAVYILSSAAVMGLVPLKVLATSNAPYVLAAESIWGHWGAVMIGVGAIISCFGALNGWTLLQGQVPYAAAKDGLLPKSFAHLSKRGTPVVGLVVSAIFMSLLLLLTLDDNLVRQFTLVILLATFATLMPYLLTSVAEVILVLRDPNASRHQSLIRLALMSIAAFLYVFLAMVGSGQRIVYYGCLLFFSGVPIYAWMKYRG